MKRNRIYGLVVLLVGLGWVPSALGQERASPTADRVQFFETKIRPVLADKCYQCHSAESGKFMGGLGLDTREGMLIGGDSGPVLEPGKPASSLIMEVIRYETAGFQMPPPRSGGKLASSIISDFENWILDGAPDPRDGAAYVPDSGAGEESRQWWAFQPVRNVAPPQPNDSAWPKSEIDRFVLHALEAKKIPPVADAEPLVLLRRVTFDLTGLPPDPDKAKKFVAEWNSASGESGRDTLYAAVVDELLASPQYGEHWGRHWMDVARYSESTGKDVNILFPQAWRYRDYIIDAFNADMPYDQFIREQVAGDLLPASDDAEKSRQLIATGFLAIGPKSLNEQNAKQFVVDLADEQIDAVTQGFMGLTVACARCHDHKFDPVSQKDYTAFAGIFLSTDTRYGTGGAVGGRNAGSLLELPAGTNSSFLPKLTRAAYERKQKQLEDLEAELKELVAERARNRSRGTDDSFSLVRVTTQVSELRNELKNYTSGGMPLPMAMGVVDKPRTVASTQPFRQRAQRGQTGGRRNSGFVSITDSPLFIRGEVDQPAERVPRGIPELFDGIKAPAIPRSTSGRKELAEWMTDVSHPLTSRVMVNRIWHWLFGAGIVDSVDNFGNSGNEPTHPGLLDWLARRYIENGWSTKALVREIVLSRTYRLSGQYSEQQFLADPANDLLWRHNPRRLDAEAIRDSILTAAGTLDLARPEASLIGRAGDGPIGGPRRATISEDKVIRASDTFRSVYMATARNAEPEFLAAFDFPDGSMVQGARQATNVPGQTLFMLNSDFTASQAESLARRIVGEVYSSQRKTARTNPNRRGANPSGNSTQPVPKLDLDDVADQLTELYWMTLSRPPVKAEISAAKKLLIRYRKDPMTGWISVARGIIASAEFRSLD